MVTTTQRKKVLFLITKSNWGGAQRYVYDLATHLDPHRFEAVVALGGDGELSHQLESAGIRTIRIQHLVRDVSIKKELAFMRELWQLLRSERPHILHVNSSKAGALGTLLGRIARVPRVIFTSHGWAFNEDRPYWQRIIIKIIHWITVLLSHRTIAVSHGILNDLRWPGAWKKMKVVHPGRTIGPMYEKKEAREKIVDFFPRLSPYLRDPWVVCVAELHPIKRHSVLFTAIRSLLAQHPTLRLLCIGEGQERNLLERQISAHNLGEHIFLLGHLSDAARFLKAATIVTLPSKSESYGYVLHEAGLAEVPVVATKVGGIPDIVEHERSGLLVPPSAPAPLARALGTLLENPETAQSYAQTLHEKMSARTVLRMTRATEDLYTL